MNNDNDDLSGSSIYTQGWHQASEVDFAKMQRRKSVDFAYEQDKKYGLLTTEQDQMNFMKKAQKRSKSMILKEPKTRSNQDLPSKNGPSMHGVCILFHICVPI